MKTIERTVNQKGLAEIRQFLAENHKMGHDFTDDMINAWASDAEYQLSEGNPPCIEIPAHNCVHGRTMEYQISADGISEEEIEI